jgi:hypothetical protein
MGQRLAVGTLRTRRVLLLLRLASARDRFVIASFNVIRRFVPLIVIFFYPIALP